MTASSNHADNPLAESFVSTEHEGGWLAEFHVAIHTRLSDYENNHFHLCEIRYEENKISHFELRESIVALLAPYPDLLIQFRELISDMLPTLTQSESNEYEEKSHRSVHFSSHYDKLITQNEASLFRLLRSHSPDYEVLIDFIKSHEELASVRNDLGQPPLHVACIKGFPFPLIMTLVDAFPEALTIKDNAGRIPLHHYVTVHCASSWKDSATSDPAEYSRGKSIADLSVDVINLLGAQHLIMQEDKYGASPLTCFALECHFMGSSNKVKVGKAKEIIDTMINFDPPFSILLFKTIRMFPNTFVKHAANNQYIKEKLNHAASSSFMFFASIILDLLIRFTIIYAYANIPSLRRRYQGENTDDHWNFALLFLGMSYLIARFMVRLRAFKEVGNTMDVTKSGWNWLQLMEIMLVSFSTIGLYTAPKNDHSVSTTLAAGIQWLSLLIVLRPASRHFVRFWSGILNVVRTLFPFFVTTCVFIFGFCFMLHFSYKYSDCKDGESCELTVLHILSLIIQQSINGEIEGSGTSKNDFVTGLTFVYGIFLVILLLNILIAVVMDAYGDTKGEKTFWFERLIYISEIEIAFPCRCLRKNGQGYFAGFRIYLESLWVTFMEFIFQPKKFRLQVAKSRGYILKKGKPGRIMDNIYRFLGLFVGIPLWLLVGFLTLGWLLPPQVKMYLLDGDIENQPKKDTSVKDDLETLQASLLKQMRHLEKRQNKKLMKLQSELESNRSIAEHTLNKLDLLIDSLKKDN